MPNRYRLDRTVEPLRYAIELIPDLRAFTFRGRETVTLRMAKPARSITLHALDLKIVHASLQRGSKTQPADRITYDAKLETATLHFREPQPAGQASLTVDFEGHLNDKLHGFYRTRYEIRGKTRWGGATQFEATDARRAFPCWDEPDRKAVFALTLEVPGALTALSNMPVAKQRAVGGGRKRITYRPTPKMPTYLLAWVIADLEAVEGRDANGVLIRVWTTPGKKAQGRFGLDVARHALAYFAKWFGIPYALPKLDMVALPDFASGAMENWGLVTYRETALLVDPKNSSAAAKQRVAEVVAHELAHQWFGNLVTMAWWTDLWLNEGFASYMGPKAVDDQFPEWQIWSQYVAGEYLGALHSDSLRNTHPIEIPVQNPHEIREIFDAITYSKGSSVNRMLEHYLTERVFRKGLSAYLKRYAFGNAATEDLWTMLQRVSGKPVKAIMASFTKQPGYPVVSASLNGRRLALSQQRFFFDGRTDRSRQRWSVPIVIQHPGNAKPLDTVLRGTALRVPVAGARDGRITINPGQSAFFRTAYAPDLLERLAEDVGAARLPALDTLGLLDDTFALAKAGHLRTSQALDLTARCAGYEDYNVWSTVAMVLGSVENILEDDAAKRRLEAVARGLFGPLLERSGWDAATGESHLDALRRGLVISRLGHYNDPGVIVEAHHRFDAFVRGKGLAPDLRGAVYTIVAEHGGRHEHDALLKLYRGTDLQEERARVLRALTRFPRRELIDRVLAFSLTDAVRRQDAYILLGGFGSNPAGRHPAWAFIKSHWKTLADRYASGGLNLMNRIIEGSVSSFTRDHDLKDVRAFFRGHPVPGAERTMKQSVEVIEARIRWARRDAGDIAGWLNHRPQLAPTAAAARTGRALQPVPVG